MSDADLIYKLMHKLILRDKKYSFNSPEKDDVWLHYTGSTIICLYCKEIIVYADSRIISKSKRSLIIEHAKVHFKENNLLAFI